MNMISTGTFQTEMGASNKQKTLAEQFAAVWEQKNAKAARAGGVSLMALSLAACGSSSSTTDTSSTSTDSTSTDTSSTSDSTSSTTVKLANDGGTYSLTTTVDGVSAPTSSSAKIYLNDNEPSDAYSFTMDASAAGSGALVIEFADAGDTATLSATSSFGNFTTLEVKNGTVDATAMTLPTGMNSVVLNSGLKVTAAQGAQITSLSGTGELTVEVTTQAEIDQLIAHMNTHGITTSVKVAAASGSTLTSADITAGNTNVAAEATSNVADTVTHEAVSLKAGTDTATSDDFSGALVGAGANGSTINAGDNLTGTDGSADKVTITATGDETGAGYTLAGVQTSGVETVQISNFYTDGTVGLTLDMALMSGVKAVNVIASSAEGDTTLSNVANIIDAAMNSGAGDLTVGYQAAVVVGTEDAQNLSVSNTTAGTFTANKIETINITSGTVKSTITDVVSDTLKSVTVSGDKDLTVSNSIDFAATVNGAAIDGTIDASAFTGKLDVTATGAQTVSITGGSANDTITMGATLTKNDVIDGGDGTDTIEIAETANRTFADNQLTNIEAIDLAVTTNSLTDFDVKGLADDIEVVVRAATTNKDVTINNLGAGQTVKVVNDAAGTKELGDVAVNLETGTGLSDSMTVKLNAKTDVDQTLDLLTVDDEAEALTIDVSGATGTGKEITLTSLIADGAKTVTLTGAGNFLTTLGETGTNVTTSIDASAMTGVLDITENVANKIAITGSAGQNTISMGTGLTHEDTIVGGASAKDVLEATIGTATTATTGKFNVTGIETVKLTATHAETAAVDLTNVTGMTTAQILSSANDGTGQVDFSKAASGLKVSTTDQANAFDGTITVALADATGTADEATLVLANKTSDDDFVFTTTDVEKVTIEAGASTVAADVNVSSANATSLVITGAGTANIDLTEDTTKLNKSVTSVDASAFKGSVVVDASGTDSVGVNFNMGDILITTTTADVITGSASTTTDDTLTATIAATDATAEFATQLNGIENYVLTLKDAVAVTATTNEGLADNDTAVKTVVLTGGNTLTKYTSILGDMDGTALTSFDASGLGGEITVDVAGGLIDQTVIKGSTASAKDVLTFSGVNGFAKATTGAFKGVEGVETIHLQTATAASTLDMATVTGATTVGVQGAQNVTFENLAATTAVQLGTSATTTEDDYSGTVTLKLADATGADDSVTVKLVAQGADNAVDAAIVAAGVESATIDVATQTASKGDADLDVSGIEAASLTVKGGTAAEDLDLSNGGGSTLHGNTDTVDASAFKGTIRIDAEANNATTMTAAGTAVATLNGSSGNDTVTLGSFAAVTHDISLGTGNDTLNMTLKTGTTALTSVDEVETYNITAASDAGAVITTAAAGKFFNGATAQTVTLTGGSSDSTFDAGTDPVDSSSTLTSFDASGFLGKITDLEFDADELAATVEVKGAASAKDNVTATFTSGSTVKMSGVENLTAIFAGGSPTVDVGTYVSDLTTIKLSSDTTARVATLNNMDAGVTVEITADDNNDGVTIVRNDASAADNVQNLEIKSGNAAEDLLLDIANVETINIKSSATNAVDLDMTNVDMDTASATNSVVFTGTKNIDIITMSADTTSVDASAMTAGGVDIDGRAAGSTITFKGSAAAAESVIMISSGDVLDGGTKTGISDSLDINFGAVLGGIQVDLTAADQVVTMDGVSNTAVQTGFENVDLAGYTGFGAVITGTTGVNVVTGTASTDNITLGSGDDTLTITAGNDVVTGGDGNETINITAVLLAAHSGTSSTIDAGGGTTDTMALSSMANGTDNGAIVDADFRGITNLEVLSLSSTGTTNVNDVTLGTNFEATGITRINLDSAKTSADDIVMSGIGDASNLLTFDHYEFATAGEQLVFGGTAAAINTSITNWTLSNGVYSKAGATVSDFYTAIAGATNSAGDVGAFLDGGNMYVWAEGAATGASDDSYIVLEGITATSVATSAGAAAILIA